VQGIWNKCVNRKRNERIEQKNLKIQTENSNTAFCKLQYHCFFFFFKNYIFELAAMIMRGFHCDNSIHAYRTP
jgi:hypothetical protein